jgi:hypothetical protein
MHLSPQLLGNFESWSEPSPTSMAGNTFIEQELKRIKKLFAEQKSTKFPGDRGEKVEQEFKYIRPSAAVQQLQMSLVGQWDFKGTKVESLPSQQLENILREQFGPKGYSDPAMSGELDLVRKNTTGKSIVAFMKKLEITNPTVPKDGLQEFGHSDIWKPSDISTLLDVLLLQARIYLQEVSVRNPASIEDCKIAIEENGFICFVPTNTQADDLICFFPESDAVAVARGSGNIGQLIGRAVALFKHHQNTPLRAVTETWPDFNIAQNHAGFVRALFLLDVASLQMLTHGSSMPDG